jgi:putative RNA 2'-phosphotransferase
MAADRQQLTDTSKFLSYVLRHAPESVGVTMDPAGWVDIDELIELAGPQRGLSVELIAEVVAANDKQRFALSADRRRIRANQGHSIDIDLGLEPIEPPHRLYHGTATRFLTAILDEGLRPGSRQHVHLSGDVETARRVGQRHGKPVVLTVDAAGLHAEGHTFHRSANGVWLTAAVPARWLSAEGA